MDLEYKACFTIDEFRDPNDHVIAIRAIFHMLNALVNIDVDYLEKHPNTPLLYNTGYRYIVDGKDQDEEWKSIPSVVRRRSGDCKDFACWRIAELQTRYGVEAQPSIQYQQFSDGSQLYHIQVLLPDNTIEDPSRILGMP